MESRQTNQQKTAIFINQSSHLQQSHFQTLEFDRTKSTQSVKSIKFLITPNKLERSARKKSILIMMGQ